MIYKKCMLFFSMIIILKGQVRVIVEILRGENTDDT